MAVRVDSISFNSELTSGSTDYLLGNVLNSVTATVNISVGWFAFASASTKILFAPTTGYPNPDEVIREMASNMLANPQPGGSRDFSNWTNLRLQPPRPTERRRRFGQLNKSTQEFDKWK